MIDPVSIQIAVVSHEFSSGTVKRVKMFCFKPLKINLNTVSETIVFGICGCILIELMYCIFVEDVMVNRLNIYIVIKEDF